MQESNTPMEIGVIGCGSIGQIKHIPNVVESSETRLTAICDVSQYRLETLAERYGVHHSFSDPDEMVDTVGGKLDGVIVCTPPSTHVEIGVSILEADIPLLIEKPLAMTLEGANKLVAAAERSQADAIVGYMKRFDDAYQEFKREVDKRDTIDFISVFDIDATQQEINSQVYSLVNAKLSDEQQADLEQRRLEKAKQAISSDDEEIATSYYYRLERICHDLNLLRDCFGEVDSIENVNLINNGTTLRTIFNIEGVNCVVTEGWSQKREFEQYIRVDSMRETLQLDFCNPFFRNSSNKVSVQSGQREQIYNGCHDDNFKSELDHFVEVICSGVERKISLESARKDVGLLIKIFDNWQKEES